MRVARVSGRPYVANRRVERGRRASLISRGMQQTTAALQDPGVRCITALISARAVILVQQTLARSEQASAADIFFDPNL